MINYERACTELMHRMLVFPFKRDRAFGVIGAWAYLWTNNLKTLVKI